MKRMAAAMAVFAALLLPVSGAGKLGVLAGFYARAAWPAHGMAAFCGGLLAALNVCLWVFWAWPDSAPALVDALARVCIFGGLFYMFARSLRPGREPVATRIARLVHGTLDARRRRYTRGVTWLWTLVFAAELAVTPLLVLHGASLAALLSDLPLLLAVFSVELAVRAWWFRGEARGDVAAMIRAFRRARAAP